MKAKRLNFIGFEDYAVTDDGRVWSIRRKKWLKPCNSGKGYMHLKLYKDGKGRTFFIHRLVALAFLANPENLPEVNHKDENKTNNRVQNLEWISHKDNINHGTGNQRRAAKRRKKVYCIELDKTFESVTAAAKELGLWKAAISKCCLGQLKTTGNLHFKFVD